MLTADLAMSWQRGNTITPRYVKEEDAGYLQVADDLATLFREHRGRRRVELDAALDEYVGAGTDYKILRGLIKLLTDGSTFETATTIDPLEIRRSLFFKARTRHPVSRDQRAATISEAATELTCAEEEIIDGMYADLVENQRLIGFEEINARELLDRYNLAQAQALLYRCTEMRLTVAAQEPAAYRQLFDAIKACRLIHQISGSTARGYEIRLSGPVSIFHRSQKYGVQMAVFLPALLMCRGWKLRAEIESKTRGAAFFELQSEQTRLRVSDFVAMGLDNPFREKLAARWKTEEGGWQLESCREVVDLGGSAFIPDFILRAATGKIVYLEVMGFWTPRYLEERLREFERAGFKEFLLAASEELQGAREAATNLPANVILFKSSLDPREVKAAASRLAG